KNGGAAFVLICLILIFAIGLPSLLGELALGRFPQKNPVGAIRKLRGKSPWVLFGGLGVLTGFGILSYYSVIAGWTFGYIFKMLLGNFSDFSTYIASPGLNIGLMAIFILLTALVVLGGVKGGIEKWSKILMPILIGLIFLIIIRSVTLDGAMKGIVFYLKPDFSKITFRVILEALGQVFFSLSLGMGLMITYGSYLSKKENLFVSGVWVVFLNTMVSILAGFMIFPAIFALGGDPAAGTGLAFEILPKIFAQMPMGIVIGAVFFILLSIAALTSTISLFEVATAYFVDEKKMARKIAVWIVAVIVLILGIPSALASGSNEFFTNMELFGQKSFFGIMDFIWGNLSLLIGAFAMAIFMGFIWKAENVAAEIKNGFPAFDKPFLGKISLQHIWIFQIKYIIPVLIFVVLVYGLFFN
ncbi:MAG: sodium-dependent transporter, partial [Calditrichia bacterium]|nr:sodium-dependent transporter [Calditrichia bacterium]